MVEGAPLLREYGRNPIEGSNPSFSAIKRYAPVAQLDRVSGYEPEGRRFNSFRAHHLLIIHKNFKKLATNKINYPPSKILELAKLSFYLSVIMGSLILCAYFFEINYLPSSNFQSMFYIPVVVSIIGFLILICFVVLFGLTPCLWQELLKEEETCRYIVKDKNADIVINVYKNGKFDLLDELSRARISLYYVGINIIFAGIWILILLLDHPCREYTYTLFLILGTIGKHWFFLTKKSAAKKAITHNPSTIFIKILSFSIIPALSLLFSMSFLTELLMINSAPIKLCFSICFIVLSSFCLTYCPNNWSLFSWTTLIATSSFLILLCMFDGISKLSTNIISDLKLGSIKHATIVVNQKGCVILNENGIKLPCDLKKDAYAVKDIEILWRIGEYYIKFVKPPSTTDPASLTEPRTEKQRIDDCSSGSSNKTEAKDTTEGNNKTIYLILPADLIRTVSIER